MTEHDHEARYRAARWAVAEARIADRLARIAVQAIDRMDREDWDRQGNDYHAAVTCLKAKDAWGRAAVLTLIWLLA